MKLTNVFHNSARITTKTASARTDNSFEYFTKLIAFEIFWLFVYAVFFVFTKEYTLAIISILGVAGSSLLFFVGRKIYKLFVVLGHIYVMGCVWFAVKILGWCSGIQYLLFSLIALGFFNPFRGRLMMDIINIVEVSLFVYLSIAYGNLCPSSSSVIYQYISLLHVLSIIISSSIIIYTLRMTGLANSVLNQQMQHNNRTLMILANQDGLTGLHNRRSMQEFLDENWKAFQKNGSPFFLVMCDVDFLKTVNDVKGHKTGDALLQTLASILLASFRSQDLVSRWGGDEFVVLVKAPVAKNQVMDLIAQLQAAVSKIEYEQFALNSPLSLTIGVASSANKKSTAQLLSVVDACLYAGKNQGRNTVIVEE